MLKISENLLQKSFNVSRLVFRKNNKTIYKEGLKMNKPENYKEIEQFQNDVKRFIDSTMIPISEFENLNRGIMMIIMIFLIKRRLN